MSRAKRSSNGGAKSGWHPGSIYRRAGSLRLYAEYKGEKLSTGLLDTEENRKHVMDMLWELWRRDHGLSRLGLVPSPPGAPHAVLPSPAPRAVPLKEMAEDAPEKVPTLAEAIAEYERYLKSTDHKPSTIRSYKETLKKIKPRRMDARSIERAVQDFVDAWEGAPASINVHVRNYAAFTSWLVRKRYLSEKPYLNEYKRKRGIRREVKVLTECEYMKVLRQIVRRDDQEYSALIMFLYNTGLRIGEALNLTSAQLRVEDGIAVIVLANKITGNSESVPLGRRALRALKKIGTFDEDRDPHSPVKIFRWAPGSARYVLKRFDEDLESAKIEGKTGFHLLRRSFLHRLKEAGVSLEDRKHLMRHSDVRVTLDHYTYFDKAKLLDIVNNL